MNKSKKVKAIGYLLNRWEQKSASRPGLADILKACKWLGLDEDETRHVIILMDYDLLYDEVKAEQQKP